jgi:hypothetical protein
MKPKGEEAKKVVIPEEVLPPEAHKCREAVLYALGRVKMKDEVLHGKLKAAFHGKKEAKCAEHLASAFKLFGLREKLYVSKLAEGAKAGERPELVKVTAEAFAGRLHLKADIHKFLTSECGLYLPKLEACRAGFLQQVLRGEKLAFKDSEVDKILLPQYPELAVGAFTLERADPRYAVYFPDVPLKRFRDRNYFFRVLDKVGGGMIKRLVAQMTKKRKETDSLELHGMEIRKDFYDKMMAAELRPRSSTHHQIGKKMCDMAWSKEPAMKKKRQAFEFALEYKDIAEKECKRSKTASYHPKEEEKL